MNFRPMIAAALLSAAAASADDPATRGEELARVEQRIQQMQITAEERRFDEIGWAGGIREAIRLARAQGRPVFLFTHDGHMNVGRC